MLRTSLPMNWSQISKEIPLLLVIMSHREWDSGKGRREEKGGGSQMSVTLAIGWGVSRSTLWMWMVTINLVSCKVLKSLTIPLLSLTCSSYSTPIPHTSFCYKGSCVFSYHLWIIMTSSPPLLLKILPMPATRSSVISALSLCRVMSCDQLLNSYHRLKDVPFISSWKFSPQLCYHPCQVP